MECDRCDLVVGKGYWSIAGASSCDVCKEDFYMHPVGDCLACPMEATCPMEGTTLATLHVKPSWFRFTARSEDFYECPFGGEDACVGGNHTASAPCGEAYDGPLCRTCDAHFYKDGLAGTCEDCAESRIGPALVVLAVVVVAAIASMTIRWEKLKAWVANLDFGQVRVMFSTCQVLRSVPSATGTTLPEPARSFFAALDVAALNPFELVSSECLNSNLAAYDTRVVLSTCSFVAVCAVNW